MNYTNRNTIYDYISNETMEDGIHSLTLANNETIDFEIVNFSGDTVITPDTVIGNDTADTQMLIMKVAGNLTIEEGATLTPKTRKKGFVIYTDGSITNNGTISMTARGASADGQEVLLYGFNGKYETIPAVGALGGEAVGGATSISGNPGASGINRALGGGGSGASYSNNAGSRSGAGGAATSYSGGAGGGGCASYDSAQVAGDGSSTGGAGGAAASRRTTSNGWNSSGGAGNPGGANSYRTSGAGAGSAIATTSESGTGGLLIIYCKTFKNYGSVESNGSNSGQTAYNPTTHSMTGGASGAGSINIFANSASPLGTLVAKGGVGAAGKTTGTTDEDGNTIYYCGGNGGDGSITYTTMIIGTGNKLIDQTCLSTVLSDMANVIAEEMSALENKIGEGGGSSTTNITISGEEGNAISQKDDGIYVTDLSDKVNKINIAQKTVNEVGSVSLLEEPYSFTSKKATTAGLAVDTALNTTLSLKEDITNFDYIEILLTPNGAQRKRPAQIMRCRVNTIVFNNSTIMDAANGSIIRIPFDVESTTASSFGALHFSMDAWFMDSKTFFVFKFQNPSNSEYWVDFEITDIIGVKDRSIVIDPLEHVNDSVGIEDVPVGHIISFMGNTAPKHYLACDGAEYNITDYPHLAQHFIDQFGTANYFGGDGTTTFAVPDLRGEFLRGTGVNSHANQGSGSNVGEHQDGTEHIYFGVNTSTSELWVDTTSPRPGKTQIGIDKTDSMLGLTTQLNNKGYRAALSTWDGATNRSHFTSRPTNTSVLYCIKYEPTYFMKNTYSADSVYSTDEMIIGKWIDGKPLYSCTCAIEPDTSAGMKTYYYTQITNAEHVRVDFEGSFLYNESTKETISLFNSWDSTTYGLGLTAFGEETQIRVSMYRPIWYNLPGYITFIYTKTTDSAIS